ncbi:kinase related to dihydroxyacetone kinase [Candidatus Phytoplasma mali]|uniref:Kinase related to dihydroxyacetone kinase n=1 Tax=Phytoplasma mali (strain AT) TaxID=482235 RepID=B3QZS7_PHYMT|nr:DAK2 domain-containing protein [Candidatus Phytoplasma mali]CAP18464.1 kinase related to dihydroxyacetone kinase [Candidatus Phytoplasma mali]
MINAKKINADLFKKMITNGAINLKNNYKKIDNLNVFPVPDGDTGNNMKMTMMEGIKEINKIQSDSIIKIAEVLSKALLIGAKGNSGVILSQFFAGIYIKLKEINKNTINISEFMKTLICGYQKAYQAVSEPTEGTILTVIRESVESMKEIEYKDQDINELMQKIIKNSEISLEKTPQLLPILKKAKVVDSGGAGFIEILKGMLMFLQGNKLEYNNKEEENNNFEAIHNLDIEELKYIYCSEYIINLKNDNQIDKEKIKKKLHNKGNSVVLIIDENILKLHIHTNNPDIVLNYLLNYGELNKIKIDNMKQQHEKIIKTKKNNQLKEKKNSKYTIITVVSGNKMLQSFQELNADIIIDETINMSLKVNDFIEKIKEIDNRNIIILPNRTKIYLEVQKIINILPEKNIKIIKTESFAQGYSVLLTFDPNLDLEKNLNNMKQKLKNTKIGKIINEKDTDLTLNNNENNNDFICFLEEKKIYKNNDLNRARKMPKLLAN